MNFQIVVLNHPIETRRWWFKKKLVSIVTVRRPTMKDFLNVKTDDPMLMHILVSRLTGLNLKQVGKLAPSDFTQLNKVINEFVKN